MAFGTAATAQPEPMAVEEAHIDGDTLWLRGSGALTSIDLNTKDKTLAVPGPSVVDMVGATYGLYILRRPQADASDYAIEGMERGERVPVAAFSLGEGERLFGLAALPDGLVVLTDRNLRIFGHAQSGWRTRPVSLGQVTPKAVVATSDGAALYTAAPDGLHRLDLVTGASLPVGLKSTPIAGLAADPGRPACVLAAVADGVWRVCGETAARTLPTETPVLNVVSGRLGAWALLADGKVASLPAGGEPHISPGPELGGAFATIEPGVVLVDGLLAARP